MPDAPSPADIYRAAEVEGHRRLTMPALEQVSTGFIAGVTVVLGIVALGVTSHLVEPAVGRDPAKVVGALAFGIGLVLLVVGRTELFSENFFDPVAAAVHERGSGSWLQLARLWVVILALNLVGGAVLVAVVTVDGALPSGTDETLARLAEDIASKPWSATCARAVLAGVLLALLSYLLHAVDTARGRITVAYMVGFLVAVGPFDHVVVSALHLLVGMWSGAAVGWADIGGNIALATAGNVVGGVLLMTLTHTAQAKASRAHGEAD